MADWILRRTSVVRTSVAALGIPLWFAASIWMVAVAPAAVVFGLSVAASAAWCLWLEKQPS